MPPPSPPRRRASIGIIGEDGKVGVSDLVARLMTKAGSKARKNSVASAATEELAARCECAGVSTP